MYGAARFFSRDADENAIKSWWADFDPSSVFTMRGSMIGTPHALAPHLRINATQGVLPPEEAMRQFRIVHLRSLSMADDYADARPRPALTIFRSVATEAP